MPNYNRDNRQFSTTIIKKGNRNENSSSIMRKSSMDSKDMPDVLNDNNTNVFKPTKLLNGRQRKKHMTQIPQQDVPDVLLGMNEYKEVNIPRKFHSIKKPISSFNQDLPDSLEPVNDAATTAIPKSEVLSSIHKMKKEESKNQENTKKSIDKSNSTTKVKKSNLQDIKEDKEELFDTNRKKKK